MMELVEYDFLSEALTQVKSGQFGSIHGQNPTYLDGKLIVVSCESGRRESLPVPEKRQLLPCRMINDLMVPNCIAFWRGTEVQSQWSRWGEHLEST